jgi:hypothetical protein
MQSNANDEGEMMNDSLQYDLIRRAADRLTICIDELDRIAQRTENDDDALRIRTTLIAALDDECDEYCDPLMHDLLRILLNDPLSLYRDRITELALSYSLCPMHFCDYAICFDDDDDECAAIRLIHPSHDT